MRFCAPLGDLAERDLAGKEVQAKVNDLIEPRAAATRELPLSVTSAPPPATGPIPVASGDSEVVKGPEIAGRMSAAPIGITMDEGPAVQLCAGWAIATGGADSAKVGDPVFIGDKDRCAEFLEHP